MVVNGGLLPGDLERYLKEARAAGPTLDLVAVMADVPRHTVEHPPHCNVSSPDAWYFPSWIVEVIADGHGGGPVEDRRR